MMQGNEHFLFGTQHPDTSLLIIHEDVFAGICAVLRNEMFRVGVNCFAWV